MAALDVTHLVDPKLVTLTAPRSRAAEQYRVLRTNLDFLAVAGEFSQIMVTSGVPQAGKSLTAANLAIALAQAGKRTLLVDADLRRPSVHRFFGLANDEGLSHAVTRPLEWPRCVLDGPLASLSLLPAGPIPPNPAEIVGSPAMHKILGALKSAYDVVVVDTPPVLAFSDAVALSRCVDGVLLVVRPGLASRKQDLKAKEYLLQVNARLLGVVLNGALQNDEAYRYYARD